MSVSGLPHDSAALRTKSQCVLWWGLARFQQQRPYCLAKIKITAIRRNHNIATKMAKPKTENFRDGLPRIWRTLPVTHRNVN